MRSNEAQDVAMLNTYRVTLSRMVLDEEPIIAYIPCSQSLWDLCAHRSDLSVTIDGEPVALTPEVVVAAGAIVTITVMPEGGDNGIWRQIAMIVIIVASYIVLGPGGAGVQGLGLSGWQLAAAMAVANTAGALAVNSLIPLEVPSTASTASKQLPGISPTHNRLDPYAPIPHNFGKIKQYPPYAAHPFTELVGSDQFFNALYIIGAGDIAPVDMDTLKIGQTVISSFEGVDIDYLTAADVTFPSINEDQVNIPLEQNTTPGTVVTRTTAENTKYIELDFHFPRGLMRTYDDGGRSVCMVDFKVEVRLVGTSTWKQIKATEHAINLWKDLTWGTNTVKRDVKTSPRTQIDYAYTIAPADRSLSESWPTDPTGTLTDWFRIVGYTYDTVRRGLKFQPPDGVGQYEVRVTRERTYSTRSESADHQLQGPYDPTNDSKFEAYWSQACVLAVMRSHMEDDGVVPYGETAGDTTINYLRVRIKASDQLSGALDELSHIVHRIYSTTYNGTSWVTATSAASRSPAWAFVEVLNGPMNPRPVSTDHLDGPSLLAWDQWCTANGFYYDDEITTEISVWDLLKRICAAGRAEFTIRNGKYTIIQDNVVATATQIFTPRNSKGFRGVKTFLPALHGVRVNYRSATEDFELTERIVYADGYTAANATEFETIDLLGCTDDSQAYRQGRRFIAIAKLRPEFFQITVDIEHIVSLRGDAVLLQHESALVGQASGRVVESYGYTLGATDYVQVTLDFEVYAQGGINYRLRPRRNVSGAIDTLTTGVVTSVPAPNIVIVSGELASEYEPGTLVSFGEVGKVFIKCKILSIQPGADHSATIILIPEGGTSFYNSDTGTIPEYDPVISLPPNFDLIQPAAPVIRSVESGRWIAPMQPAGTFITRMVVSYSILNVAQFRGLEVQARFREYIDEDISTGADWMYTNWMPYSAGALWIAGIQEGVRYLVELRVRSLPNQVTSVWSARVLHTIGSQDHPPPIIDSLSVTSKVGGVEIDCNVTNVLVTDADHVEILYNTTDTKTGAKSYYHTVPSILSTAAEIVFFLPLPDSANRYFWARIVNKVGIEGPWVGTNSTGVNGVVGHGLLGEGVVRYYILATRGTALYNGTGTLRLEAHQVDDSGDVILTSGNIKLYKSDGTTEAGTGYVWDNIAAADIDNATVVYLRNNALTPDVIYETISLIDVYPGTQGPPGDDGGVGPAGPPGAATLAMWLNRANWTTARNNNLYIHGFDSNGDAADVNGVMIYNGNSVTVTKGTLLATRLAEKDCWIVYDTAQAGTFTLNGSASYSGVQNFSLALVRKLRGSPPTFEYNTTTGWAAFTPTSTMVVIGSYTKTLNTDSTGLISSGVLIGGGLSLGSIPVVDAEIPVITTADLAGKISDLTPFANSLQPLVLVSSLTTTGTWTGPSLVLLTTTNKLYRLQSNTPPVWTAAVAGGDITANSIIGGSIVAGGISTRELNAGAVTAGKLAVTGNLTLNKDPEMRDLEAWFVDTAVTVRCSEVPATYSILTTDTNPYGTTVMRINTATGYTANLVGTDLIPIDPTKTYRVSVRARKVSGNQVSYCAIIFYDKNGNIINANNNTGIDPGNSHRYAGGAWLPPGWSSGSLHYWGCMGTELPSTLTEYSHTFGANGVGVIPYDFVPVPNEQLARSFRVSLIAQYAYGANLTATVTDWCDYKVEEMTNSVLIENGAVIADKLAANSVTAGKVAANAVTAREILAGSITADRMQLGGANLVSDPHFEFSFPSNTGLPAETINRSGWSRTGSEGDTPYRFKGVQIRFGSNVGAEGSNQYAALAPHAQGSNVELWSNSIPVAAQAVDGNPNYVREKYLISCKTRTSAAIGATGYGYPLYVWFYNNVGALISQGSYGDDGTGDGHFDWVRVGPWTGTWLNVSAEVTVPVGATIMLVGSACNFATAAANEMYVDAFRCVCMTNASLLVNGAVVADKIAANAVTAEKLQATLVLASTITTKVDTSNRVIIDSSSVPIWVGSGAKNAANAQLQYDQANNLMTMRGVLNVTAFEPDATNAMGVLASGDVAAGTALYAPVVGFIKKWLTPGTSSEYSLIANTVLTVGTFGKVSAPAWGSPGIDSSRLQTDTQPFLVDLSAYFFNASGADATLSVYLEYSLGQNIWVHVDGATLLPDAVIRMSNLGTGRGITVGFSKWYDLPTGWYAGLSNGWCQFRIRVESSRSSVYLSGTYGQITVPNLGAIAEIGSGQITLGAKWLAAVS